MVVAGAVEVVVARDPPWGMSAAAAEGHPWVTAVAACLMQPGHNPRDPTSAAHLWEMSRAPRLVRTSLHDLALATFIPPAVVRMSHSRPQDLAAQELPIGRPYVHKAMSDQPRVLPYPVAASPVRIAPTSTIDPAPASIARRPCPEMSAGQT